MKPKPLVVLKNFTVPVVAMGNSPFEKASAQRVQFRRRQMLVTGKGSSKNASSLRVCNHPSEGAFYHSFNVEARQHRVEHRDTLGSARPGKAGEARCGHP